MTDKPNQLVDLLGQLTRAAAKLSKEEITEVLEGKKRLSIIVESKRPPESKRDNLTRANPSDILDKLKVVATREEAQILIDKSMFLRSDLASLARLLDIPVQKSDDIVRIKEKVVEATIGFKLRSRAIQG